MTTLEGIIKKYFDISNLGHAYLLKTKEYSKVIEIAKKILSSDSTDENVEFLIEQGIYSDLVVIEPDGQWIKKEQILELKNKFKTKSSSGNKQIYIIKNAENLNPSSGNTLLKFLEEPEENIIGFLITNNKNKVLETVVSRCQYISLDSNTEMEIEISNSSEIIDFIDYLEIKKQNSSLYVYDSISKIEDKNEIKKFLIKILNIYEKILLIKLNCYMKKDIDNEIVDKIIKNNTIMDIKKRISGLIEVIDLLEYNINIKMLVDKLIISMFGVE